MSSRPGEIAVWRIEQPSGEEKAALVSVYDRAAWKQYNFLCQLAEWDQDRLHDINYATLNPACVDGEVWAAKAEGSEEAFGAVAIWCPPGVGFWETEEQREMGMNQFLARTSPEHQAWFEKSFLPVMELETKVFPDPLEVLNSYYLAWIATLPGDRKKGLAGALVRKMEERARKEGKKMTLLTQSDANARYYETLGFRTAHKAEVEYRDGSRDPWYIMVHDCS